MRRYSCQLANINAQVLRVLGTSGAGSNSMRTGTSRLHVGVQMSLTCLMDRCKGVQVEPSVRGPIPAMFPRPVPWHVHRASRSTNLAGLAYKILTPALKTRETMGKDFLLLRLRSFGLFLSQKHLEILWRSGVRHCIYLHSNVRPNFLSIELSAWIKFA